MSQDVVERFPAEIESLIEWCVQQINEKSVPGLIVGLSGTDSIIAFLVCAEAFRRVGKPGRAKAVHFGKDFTPGERSLEDLDRILRLNPAYRLVPRVIVPWLRKVVSNAQIIIREDGADFNDHHRWAELFTMSLDGVDPTRMIEDEGHYWVVGTRNATEEALGTYSNLSSAVSLQPIVGLWKSDVLKLCEQMGVPSEAVRQSRQVDCDCGRFDLAADHIEEVDAILKHRLGVVAGCALNIEPELRGKLEQFIEEQMSASGFKNVIPYRPPASNLE